MGVLIPHIVFQEAVKVESRARMALVGPAGSGKSLTMLRLARLLAGPGGKIFAADTEQKTLRKYSCKPGERADNVYKFNFQVYDEFTSYPPEMFYALMDAAEAAGAAVFCCDSLSHFWMGEGGALEYVDQASKRIAAKRNGQSDSFAGWKEWRPHERKMVERMLASPMHVIVTMRVKTEYQEITDDRGKKKRVKIGLQPIQRADLEYEFDFVGYMDDENSLVVDKSRCPEMNGLVISKPDAKAFLPFVDWLGGAKPEPEVPGVNGNGASAEQLPAELLAVRQSFAKGGLGAVVEAFEGVKQALLDAGGDHGAARYAEVLGSAGVLSSAEFKSSKPAFETYRKLWDALCEIRAHGVPFSGDAAEAGEEAQAPSAPPPTGPYQATDDDVPEIIGGGNGHGFKGLTLACFDATQQALLLDGMKQLGKNRATTEAFLGTFEGTVGDALDWVSQELAIRRPV